MSLCRILLSHSVTIDLEVRAVISAPLSLREVRGYRIARLATTVAPRKRTRGNERLATRSFRMKCHPRLVAQDCKTKTQAGRRTAGRRTGPGAGRVGLPGICNYWTTQSCSWHAQLAPLPPPHTLYLHSFLSLDVPHTPSRYHSSNNLVF